MQSPNVSKELHPGMEVENLYPLANLEKHKRHSIFYQRQQYAFNSLAWGSTQNILLNKGDLLSDMFISMTLAPGTVYAIPAVKAINRIEIYYGSAQPQTVLGQDVYMYTFDSCESTSKREELIEQLGGSAGVLASNKTVNFPLGHLVMSKLQAVEKLPLDSNLLPQIKIFIYLNNQTDVYSSGGANLVKGQLLVRSAVFADEASRMVLKPNQAVNYPFPFTQSFVSPSFTPPSSTTQNNIFLTGFRSGHITGILFRSIDVSKQNIQSEQTNKLENIQLSLNGATLYKFDDNTYDMSELFQNKCATNWTVGGTKYWYYQVNFVQTAMKNENYGLIHQSGIQLSNQNVLLQFTSASTNSQIIQACYVYNGNLICINESSEIVV